jgi:radical SAM superfamily enzyme YgiQ (UPF0313 family)
LPILDPRLVLIHPPAISKRYLRTKFMPYGMSVIYAFLKEHGVPILQYDFLMEYLFAANDDIDYHNPERTFSEKDYFEFLAGQARHKGLDAFTQKYGSRIVADAGVYAFSIVAYHQFWSSLLLARYIKDINPLAIVVFGGPFITIKPTNFFMHYGIADYWVKGSGELPLLMLHGMLQGAKDLTIDQIPGIIHGDERDSVQTSKSMFPAEEERPPDFGGLSLDSYRYDHYLTGTETLFLPYRFSKGCPSRCSFCTGRLVDRYDCKSVDKIVSELFGLAQKYQSNSFQFADASINGNPRLLSAVCDRLIDSSLKITWYAYARISGFNKELLEKARRAGCFALFWGVESANQPTVDLLGKGFRTEHLHHILDEASALGIKNYVHLMYNTPHESAEDIQCFARLVEEYIDSDLVNFLPQRFMLESHSLMFDYPNRYGLLEIKKVEASRFEREQWIYQETDGIDYDAVELRNESHRKALADHLDRITFRNMFDGSRFRLLRAFPYAWILYVWKRSETSRFMNWIQRILMTLMRSSKPRLKEQL